MVDPQKLSLSPEEGFIKALELLGMAYEAYFQLDIRGESHSIKFEASGEKKSEPLKITITDFEQSTKNLTTYEITGTPAHPNVDASEQNSAGKVIVVSRSPWVLVSLIDGDKHRLEFPALSNDPLYKYESLKIAEMVPRYSGGLERRIEKMVTQFPELVAEIDQILPEGNRFVSSEWTVAISGSSELLSQLKKNSATVQNSLREVALSHPLLALVTLETIKNFGIDWLNSDPIGKNNDWQDAFEAKLVQTLVNFDHRSSDASKIEAFAAVDIKALTRVAEELENDVGATVKIGEESYCFTRCELTEALKNREAYLNIVEAAERMNLIPASKPQPRQ